ncbi:MAG: DUF4231 domain-containing protein [Gammaproteobacteria bacterium]|nr:DUF4231 domain-containing protein [Gammaproteobacteria bacterium]
MEPEQEIWPTNHYASLNTKYKKSSAKYAEMIRQLKLSPYAKTQLTLRFTNLVNRYDRLIKTYNFRLNFLRVLVMCGGTLVPSLVVAGEILDDDECRKPHIVAWITLVISIITSMSSACMEIFSIQTKYQNFILTSRQLDYEAWTFFSLSGRYSKFKRHAYCWRKFAIQVEHINSMSIENFASLSQDQEPSNPSSMRYIRTNEFSQSVGSTLTSHSDDLEIGDGRVSGVVMKDDQIPDEPRFEVHSEPVQSTINRDYSIEFVPRKMRGLRPMYSDSHE